jgi:hypothetical protein
MISREESDRNGEKSMVYSIRVPRCQCRFALRETACCDIATTSGADRGTGDA